MRNITTRDLQRDPEAALKDEEGLLISAPDGRSKVLISLEEYQALQHDRLDAEMDLMLLRHQGTFEALADR